MLVLYYQLPNELQRMVRKEIQKLHWQAFRDLWKPLDDLDESVKSKIALSHYLYTFYRTERYCLRRHCLEDRPWNLYRETSYCPCVEYDSRFRTTIVHFLKYGFCECGCNRLISPPYVMYFGIWFDQDFCVYQYCPLCFTTDRVHNEQWSLLSFEFINNRQVVKLLKYAGVYFPLGEWY